MNSFPSQMSYRITEALQLLPPRPVPSLAIFAVPANQLVNRSNALGIARLGISLCDRVSDRVTESRIRSRMSLILKMVSAEGIEPSTY